MTPFFMIAAVLVLVRYRFYLIPGTARILDGDSLVVRGDDWRIMGYDAPEWDQPGGHAARAHLHAILASGPALAIVHGRDLYDRRLARVLTLRGPVSWRMCLAGHGHGEGFVGGLLTFVARMLRRGLWGRPGGGIMPRLWRSNR